MKNLKIGLVKLPVASITLFFFCCLIAAYIHPGTEKEIISFKSDRSLDYSKRQHAFNAAF